MGDVASASASASVIGIDLGATKVAIGLVDPQGAIVATRRFPTDAHLGVADAIERIARAVDDMQAEAGVRIGAVGACSPGPVDHVAGVILDPPNLGWQHVAFGPMLSGRMNLPVCLEHDAKASAMGEFRFGTGRDCQARDLVFVIVGTGVGAAVVLDGQLYRGRNNAAGEIGHITLDRHGEPGSSGVPGCVESFMSGPYLVKRYAHVTGTPEAALSGQAIVRRASDGDGVAVALLADAGDALGAAVASTAMMFDVDLFVIGGSIAKAGDLLLQPARAAVPRYAFQSVASRVRIVATQLHEDGAILGCAWQARQLLQR